MIVARWAKAFFCSSKSRKFSGMTAIARSCRKWFDYQRRIGRRLSFRNRGRQLQTDRERDLLTDRPQLLRQDPRWCLSYAPLRGRRNISGERVASLRATIFGSRVDYQR